MSQSATEYVDLTTGDAFIPEVWGPQSLEARESALVLADLVDRRFEDAVKSYGDTIHVTPISNLTVVTKNGSANAATLWETVTETNIDVTIGTWQYHGLAVEFMVQRQARLDILKAYAGKQGYALAQAVDDVLAGLIDDFSHAGGTLGVPNTYEEILTGNQALDDADAPSRDRVLYVSPATKAALYQMDQFVNGDYSKLNANVKGSIRDNNIGTWLGLPVIVSTNVEGSNAAGHDNGIFQREALALVMQIEPEPMSMRDLDSMTNKVVVQQLYGVKEMRDDHGYWLKGA